MPAQVFLNLRGSPRRVDGNRHPSREQYAEKCLEILSAGRQHERDGFPGDEIGRHETLCHRVPAVLEISVGECIVGTVLIEEVNVDLVWMTLTMPIEHVEQRSGPYG